MELQPLDTSVHKTKGFDCGAEPQNRYLHRFAKNHARKGFSMTHVLVEEDEPSRILGYITLATCHIEFDDMAPKDTKGFPYYPVPGIRICQLAVSVDHRGRALGDILIAKATQKAMNVRDDKKIGIAVMVVDVQDNAEHLTNYYRSFGFTTCIKSPNTMYLCLGRPGT